MIEWYSLTIEGLHVASKGKLSTWWKLFSTDEQNILYDLWKNEPFETWLNEKGQI